MIEASVRSDTPVDFLPDSTVGVLLFTLVVFGMVRSAATKMTNGTDRASGGTFSIRDAPDQPGPEISSALRFSHIDVDSNVVSIGSVKTVL